MASLIMIHKLELYAHCICNIWPYFRFFACPSNEDKKSSDLMSMCQGKSGIRLASLQSSQTSRQERHHLKLAEVNAVSNGSFKQRVIS